MPGSAEQVAALGSGGALLAVLGVALLLGLRHATDPDHLTAVTTLLAAEDDRGAGRAGRLGLAWGLGHATTLMALGIPLVLFKAALPEAARQLAEVAVGAVIVWLASRLLVRHLRTRDRRHEHPVLAGRSPRQAYGIGLLHGVGGSGGVAVVALAGLPDHAFAVFALALFAAGTALSMCLLSSGLGYALARRPRLGRVRSLVPAMGVPCLAFGAWYALAGLQHL